MAVADKASTRKNTLVNDDLLVIDGQEIKPGAKVGHFEINRKLGEGAMASVYLATDIDLQRSVAIKFLNRSVLATPGNESLQDTTEQRFIREARSAAMVNHPNIAKIYTADFQHENWYIVMEFIDGSCVMDLLNDGNMYDAHGILDFASQIVSGLNYAWNSHKIIHRDIKPQNIMQDKRKSYKLVDMGLAKPVVDEGDALNLTTAGIPVGTPYYMAPEQAEGRSDIDHRADIFALGATIHEMCTHSKTFEARSAALVYLAQIKQKYVRICDSRPDLPQALSDLVDRMLEPKLEKRIDDYDEIQELITNCRTALDDKPQKQRKIDLSGKAEDGEESGQFAEKTVRLSSDAMDELRNRKKKLEKTVSEGEPTTTKSKSAALSKKKATEAKAAKSEPPTPNEPPKERAEPKVVTRSPDAEDEPVEKKDPGEAIKRAKEKLARAKALAEEKARLEKEAEEEQEPKERSLYDEDEQMGSADTIIIDPQQQELDIARIISAIKKRRNLPALDSNILELSNVIRKANSRVSDLTAVIQRDSSLSSNLLSTINSSLYSPRQPIESISAAVVLLGFDKVKSLAARLSIFYQAHRSVKDESLYRLLTSSYFAGTFTQNLTKRAGYKHPEEAFVAGLLHQMPRLILANTFPKLYAELQALVLEGMSVNRACQEVFRVGYPEVCDAINLAWNLPKGIACSFTDASDGKSFMRPYVRQSCHLADMLFGQVLGGRQEISAVEAKIRDLLQRKDFNAMDFINETCMKDDTIQRFFHMSENAIEKMIADVEAGTAHMSAAERKINIDFEQPVRTITDKQQAKLDQWSREISDAAEGLDINKAIQNALAGIKECSPCDHVFTVLLNASKDRLMGRFYLGCLKKFEPAELQLKRNEARSKLVFCIDKQKSLRCTGTKRNLRLDPILLTRLDIAHVLLVPIVVDDQAIGLFMLGRQNSANKFTDNDLAQVEVISDAIAAVFKQYSANAGPERAAVPEEQGK